jgi:hypothetical protein
VKKSILICLMIFGFSSAAADSDSSETWPRKFSSDGKQFTIYQPQVENWQGTHLEERAAVSVETSASPEPVFGVMWINGRTDVDNSQRLVALQDIKVSKIDFPSAPDQLAQLQSTLQNNVAKVLGTISLDRLRASLAIGAVESKRKTTAVKNDPPQIFYSDSPATLILIDGPAVLRDSGEEKLKRVVNTRALILFNSEDGQFYANVSDTWYKASKVTGPWQSAIGAGDQIPGLNKLKASALASNQAEGAEKPQDDKSGPIKIFTSEEPAELIQTKGTPQFDSISQTEILYVKNSPDNIFLFSGDQKYYVTLSGRWFRSSLLKGPWSFVAADQLPGDFAKIPETHPKAEVLASVAGTASAKEAAIAQEIPQTATVDRQKAKLDVVYDGDPQFKPIDGSNMQYAINTSVNVIKVNDSSYFAVDNGVWFSGPTPRGPWTVATEVPPGVYDIPPSSPVYNVTYVYVYGATPRYVYTGYLPGYLGSYVGPGGVVVYGTGYYYRPWVSQYWYGYPVTYGYGLAWGYGFGWAFRPAFYGAPVYHPYWGPWPHYWAWRNVNRPVMAGTVNHLNVYNSWDRKMIRPTQFQHYRAATAAPAGEVHNFHNNVYADKGGQVYRHNGQSWEQYSSAKKWQPAHIETPAHPMERERVARQRGEVSANRYRAPAPVVRSAPVRQQSQGKRR